MSDFQGRGIAAGYARGRAHIRKLNDDRSRFAFIELLYDACHDGKIMVTEIEGEFIRRIVTETNATVPQIFSGDANICDSLRRKYEPRMDTKTHE